jgi:phosphoribosylanthranilate isomerase
MWVKICANTSLDDARLALELGADAVGFVFAPSARQVTPEQVAAIVPELPESAEKIGVFVAGDAAAIGDVVRATGLTGVQLHGSYDAELTRRLREGLGDRVTIIQTLHWRVDGDGSNSEEVAAQLEAIEADGFVDRVMVDSKTGKGSGGTGIAFDWRAASAIFAGSRVRLIVAGGLRPENVAEAIGALKPWGVDVASGVEAVPGRKDPAKLLRFLENARTSQTV